MVWTDRTREERVEELTGWLRTSPDPLFVRLRALIPEKGIDVQRALLAELFPDDSSLEFGILVTEERRVFQFDFDYLHVDIERGRLITWRELLDRRERWAYEEGINAALRILDRRP